ncbi:MAG: biosynthetic-type acetolactate synthase large subunit [Clostridium chrysemydis]|uniref:biosynthetic-type acetolactate synthase large subunit n=1 Tax=Clostridium TaxID=1485 RepID=UPI00215206E5|nr:biosynthetic-type acetolactate synthase large subunit [Clostridium sp. LY3-2]MCR6514741.1 biosynthetic-type acetolactate synthase large subunit [Clostridium sp. LY3-2]
MLLTGAEILVKTLIDEGVDTIFGYPGGAVLNIYDELYKSKDKINHILTCHEQNAAHAADGYSRATGKVGVCLATSGPGATNLVTGIATAYMDSIPLIAITGNVTKPLLGKDSFQEVDIYGITMPITKHNYIVKDVRDLQRVIREAFKIAKEGRPGPVLIDIPKDITANKAIYEEEIACTIKKAKKNYDDLNVLIDLINKSKKPFIYAGGGIIASNASKELLEFGEKIDSPICTSLMAQSAIDNNHRLYTGMIGMHGTKASNITATKCDLLITLGARFSDRVVSSGEHLGNAKIIQIDVDPAEINKNIKVDAHVIGDLKEVLKLLTENINESKKIEWNKAVNSLKTESNDNSLENLTPEFLFRTLNSLDDGKMLITTEVGQHQMWAAQYFSFKSPRSFISSGGLGTMGYGLGASIGAKIGKPESTVINIAGDGSFGMNSNEFATAVKNKLPIIVIIMNNNALGMVRQWQTFFYDGRYSETTLDRQTDFVKLAEAYGGVGYRVTKRSELKEVLEEALKSKVPVVIDYLINNDKKVFPMVAPGAPINQIISEEDV